MSEVTFETGEVPICPYCEMKHVTDAKAQSEGHRKQLLSKIQKELAKITKTPLKDYEKVREMEHRLEDYQAHLRDLRHKIENSNPRRYLPHGLTKCEKKFAKVRRKLSRCIKKLEPRERAGEIESAVAVCRASIRCPP